MLFQNAAAGCSSSTPRPSSWPRARRSGRPRSRPSNRSGSTRHPMSSSAGPPRRRSTRSVPSERPWKRPDPCRPTPAGCRSIPPRPRPPAGVPGTWAAAPSAAGANAPRP